MWSKLHTFARLACVRHAASVQSEPESNSPVNNFNLQADLNLRSTLAESQFQSTHSSLVKEPNRDLSRRASCPVRAFSLSGFVGAKLCFLLQVASEVNLFFSFPAKSFLSPAERKKVNRYNLLQRTRRLFLSGERSYPPLSKLRQLFFRHFLHIDSMQWKLYENIIENLLPTPPRRHP